MQICSRSSGYPVVVVTGASGFLGSNLFRALSQEHHVIGLNRSHWWTANPASPMSDPFLLPCIPDLPGWLSDWAPASIYHLANSFHNPHTPQVVNDMVSCNIGFAASIAEAASLAASRFINVGTYWQTDATSRAPNTLYGATKKAFSGILDYFVDFCSLDLQEVLLPHTYGPGDRRNKLIPYLLSSAANGSLAKLGAPDRYLDVVFVDDVVKTLLDIGSTSLSERYWRLIAPDSPSVHYLVGLVEMVSSRKIEVEWKSPEGHKQDANTRMSSHVGLEVTDATTLENGLRLCWSSEGGHF